MTRRTYFISDLHLGANYIADKRAHEARVVDFLHSILNDAEALYLVGDVLDYWFEYRTVVPRGFVRFFGALASLADAGVRITWLTGNHDIWLFDYLRDEIGIEVIDGSIEREIYGKRYFIAHGDGLGRTPTSFRFMRSLFRNHLCQKLYSGIHPRWTIPFAHGWSSSSRGADACHPGRWEGAMRDSVRQWAGEFATAHPELDYIVLGHHHVAVDEPAGPHCRLVILGDWIHLNTYAVASSEQNCLTLHSL